uniref:Uncharacterized protein n=1 Tax=uncultured Alphaproteobacteria bacterium TaxID=91750 RepID=A0A6G8F2N7_9PROT|nr:hypothetical protein PlAlph_0850 [uncultured Alphaproteobacteria bacterium]
MKKFLIYLTVISVFFAGPAVASGDIDSMLFGPAKKITASPKNNPLIPHLSTPEQDGTAAPKNTTPQKAEKKVQEEKTDELPQIGITPQKKAKNSKSLTEEIKEIEGDVKEKKDSVLKDTWVEKLGETLSKSSSEKGKNAEDEDEGSDSLESLTRGNRKNGRSNASVFDISGVMLRMSLNQAEAAVLKRGYKKVSQKLEIPNFIKWRYEEQCRNSGVVGYERLNSCVVKAAKDTNHQYVESSKYVKYDSQEEINIWLTSNFTNNKIYKITYSTGITNINRGSGQKIQYLRNIKTYEFWRRINQKYGTPDNKTEVLWGLGGNKPYMKASTGRLMLEDPMLRELDYTRMSREDAKFMNTGLYNF